MEKKNTSWKTALILFITEIPSLAFLGSTIYLFTHGHPIVGSFCLALSLLTLPQINI